MYERTHGTFLAMRRPSFKPFGWELYIYKIEGDKTFRADYNSIKWIETHPHQTQNDCFYVNDIDHVEPMKHEAEGKGRISAMQNEIDYLRKELSKALERAAK